MPTIRQKRVADRIRLELSDLLLREVRDPRLSMITVTDVTIDREFLTLRVEGSFFSTNGLAKFAADSQFRDLAA